MSDAICIEADAFGVRWLRCRFHEGWLFAGTIGAVAKTVPVRVVYPTGERLYVEARLIARELRRAGYERVEVVVEEGEQT